MRFETPAEEESGGKAPAKLPSDNPYVRGRIKVEETEGLCKTTRVCYDSLPLPADLPLFIGWHHAPPLLAL